MLPADLSVMSTGPRRAREPSVDIERVAAPTPRASFATVRRSCAGGATERYPSSRRNLATSAWMRWIATASQVAGPAEVQAGCSSVAGRPSAAFQMVVVVPSG